MVSGWINSPIRDDEQLDTMELAEQVETGYGVLCKGLLVVDVDSRNGGVESFERLRYDVPETEKAGLIVNTGSGGGSRHLYFKIDPTIALMAHLGDYPGIDFRSGASFVVGPGSMHASGRPYEVAYGSIDDIDDAPLELIDLLRKPERHRAEINGSVMDVSHQDLADMLSHVDPDTDHETWVRCGMALHHASGGTAFEVWDQWSNRGSKYPGRDPLAKRWHSFGKSVNPVTFGTLIYYAAAAGWKQPVTFEVTEKFDYEHQDAPSKPNAPSSTVKTWSEPLPFGEKLKAKPYPIEALPEPIRLAVKEVQNFVQAPVAMVASSALGALSLACQAHVDVKRAEGLQGPSGLYLLTIADSGERKSSCDGFFTKGLRRFEKEAAEKAKPLLDKFDAEMELWEQIKKGLKEKVFAKAKGGASTEEDEMAYKAHVAKRPHPPKKARLFFTDTTPEALAHALSKQWPSAGVMSSEAGLIFGGHGMGKDVVTRNLALYNVLWDGASIAFDRRTSESFVVDGARLTISLQVQPATIIEFIRRSGDLARGTGFFARFLFVWPVSTQGSRLFRDPPDQWPALNAFNDTVFEILNVDPDIDDWGRLKPSVYSLSSESKAMWVAFHDEVERQLITGGAYEDVRDVASKIADNAARLAGLFHVFSGKVGPIDAVSFAAARPIVEWHLHESRRFFSEMTMPIELADAGRVERWMIDVCQRTGELAIRRNEIRQKGPVRNKKLLGEALKELEQLGRIREAFLGRARAIEINPLLLNS